MERQIREQSLGRDAKTSYRDLKLMKESESGVTGGNTP